MRISDWSSDVCSSDLQPGGRFLAALGQRRLLGTMNHIVPAQPPRREPPETVLIGQDHRTLVLGGVGRGAFDPAHHQLAVLDGEAHASLDPIERGAAAHLEAPALHKSEERRVGKDWDSTYRSRWS